MTQTRSLALLTALFVLTLPGIAGERPCPELRRLPPSARPAVEVVFVLDTTGSMGGLIEAAKRKIWTIANAVVRGKPAPEVRMGLVRFRDRGDSYVVQRSPLTDDLDRIYAELIEFEAGGGGDGPESVNQALLEAVDGFDWSGKPTTLRLIFLVGDAPPHMDYEDDVPYGVSCARAAALGIIVNTIQCGAHPETRDVWNQIAACAGGDYFAIHQSGGAQVIETPFDADLARHSALIDTTLVPYGNAVQIEEHERRAKVARSIDESGSGEALAERAAFRAVGVEERDLVQEVGEGRIALDEIDDERLPERLRSLGVEERRQYIDDRAAMRRGLRSEIEWLAEQRRQFIDRHYPVGEDGFDRSVLRSLRCQAAGRGIAYD